MIDDDDWYRDVEDSPEERRREVILGLVREAVQRVESSPVTLRTVTIDFDARTVSIDGRKYGPIEQAAFTFPIVDTAHPMMPSRTHEPW